MLKEAKASWRWEWAGAQTNFQMNIYAHRKNRGWTQKELADRLSMKQPQVARHEAGYSPSTDTISKYAHVFGVTIADLLGDPIPLNPQPCFNEQGEQVGTWATGSTAKTFTAQLDWRQSL